MRSGFRWIASCTMVPVFALGLVACDNAVTSEKRVESPVSAVPTVEVGAPAPQFDLPGSDGQTHKLADYSGQHVVLAFFPKAFTGG